MKNKLITVKLFMFGILLSYFQLIVAQQFPSSDDYNYNTFKAQKQWIVGKFLNEDNNWELEFTKDGKCHERFVITTDSTPCEYTYSIAFSTRKADTPSGHFNVYTLHLKPLFPSDSCENDTYEMYVNDKVLDLYPMDRYGAFLFYKIKPKKSAAATPKKEEEKPVERKQTAAQAYVAGEQDCLLGRVFEESLENRRYSSNYLRGWEKARCPL